MAPRDVASGSIGTVQTLSGSVEVRRADGTVEVLNKGDHVLEGDTLLTKPGAAVGVVFNDGTTMSLGEKGSLVLDKMAYDPASKTGEGHLTLQSGTFALVSGKIAKASPDALSLKTPTMTVGVRGTGLAGNANTVAMMQEKGGLTGEVFITSNSGQSITLNGPGQAASLSPSGELTSQMMTPAQVMAIAGNAGGAVSNLLSGAFSSQAQGPTPSTPENNQNQQQNQKGNSTEGPNGQQGQNAVPSPDAVFNAKAALAAAQGDINALVKDMGERLVLAVNVRVAEAGNKFDAGLAERIAKDLAAAGKIDLLITQVQAYYNRAHADFIDAQTAYGNFDAATISAKAIAARGEQTAVTSFDADADTAGTQTFLQVAQGHAAGHTIATVRLESLNTLLAAINTDATNAEALATAAANIQTTALTWRNGTVITEAVNANTAATAAANTLGGLRTAALDAATAEAAAWAAARDPVIQEAAAQATRDTLHSGLGEIRVSLGKAFTDYLAAYGGSSHAEDFYGLTTAMKEAINEYSDAVSAYLRTHLGATKEQANLDVVDGTVLAKLDALIAKAVDDATNDSYLPTPDLDLHDNVLSQAIAAWMDAETAARAADSAASASYNQAHAAAESARVVAGAAQTASVNAASAYASAQTIAATAASTAATKEYAEVVAVSSFQIEAGRQMDNWLTQLTNALGSDSASALGSAKGDVAVALAAYNAAAAKVVSSSVFDLAAALDAYQNAVNAVDNLTTLAGNAGTYLSNAATVLNLVNTQPGNYSDALQAAKDLADQAQQKAVVDYAKAVAIQSDIAQQKDLAIAYMQQAAQVVTTAEAYQALADAANAQTVAAAQLAADAAVTQANNAWRDAQTAKTKGDAAALLLNGTLDAGESQDLALTLDNRIHVDSGSGAGTAVTALGTMSNAISGALTSLGNVTGGSAAILANATVAAKVLAAQNALAAADGTSGEIATATSLLNTARTQLSGASSGAAAQQTSLTNAVANAQNDVTTATTKAVDAHAVTGNAGADVTTARDAASLAADAAKDAAAQSSAAALAAKALAAMAQNIASLQNQVDTELALAVAKVKVAVEAVTWAKADYDAAKGAADARLAVNSTANASDSTDDLAAISASYNTLTASGGKLAAIQALFDNYATVESASVSADQQASATIRAAYNEAIQAKTQILNAQSSAGTALNSSTAGAAYQLSQAEAKAAAALAATTAADAVQNSAQAVSAANEAIRLAGVIDNLRTQAESATSTIDTAYANAIAAQARLQTAQALHGYAADAATYLTTARAKQAEVVECETSAKNNSDSAVAALTTNGATAASIVSFRDGAHTAASDAQSALGNSTDSATAAGAAAALQTLKANATTAYNALSAAQKTTVITDYYNYIVKAAADAQTLADDAANRVISANKADTSATNAYDTLDHFANNQTKLYKSAIDAAVAQASAANTAANTAQSRATTLYSSIASTVSAIDATAQTLQTNLATFLGNHAGEATASSILNSLTGSSTIGAEPLPTSLYKAPDTVAAKLLALKNTVLAGVSTGTHSANTDYSTLLANPYDPNTAPTSQDVTDAKILAANVVSKAQEAIDLANAMDAQQKLLDQKVAQITALNSQFQSLIDARAAAAKQALIVDAVNDAFSGNENVAVGVNVSTNDVNTVNGSVIITALPTYGSLLLSGVIVTLNQSIAVSNLGNLQYQASGNYAWSLTDSGTGTLKAGSYDDTFSYKLSQGGSYETLLTNGSLGTTSFTVTDGASATITVGHVNHAPTLAGTAPSLISITEDVASASNTGSLVSSIMAGRVADVDTAKAGLGMALTSLATGAGGTWQYSTDGGTSWIAIPAVAANNAFLLASTDRIRFVPNSNADGTATFTFRAWDGGAGTVHTGLDTTGTTGGYSSLSSGILTGSIIVSPVAHAPTLSATNVYSGSVTAIALGITLTANASDPDPYALKISGVPAGATLSLGTSTGGGVWTLSGSDITNLSTLTMTPPAGYNGDIALTVTATATDGTASATNSTTFTVGVGAKQTQVDGTYDGSSLARSQILLGGANADIIKGGSSADTLFGNGGADTLFGGGGGDELTGGAGADVFAFSSASDSTATATDLITDFVHGVDKASLVGAAGYSMLHANFWAGSVSASVAAIVGNGQLNNTLAFFTDGVDGWVYVKGAGTGTSYDGGLVKLAGITTAPVASDFVQSMANAIPVTYTNVTASDHVGGSGTVGLSSALAGETVSYSLWNGTQAVGSLATAHGSLTIDSSTGVYTFTPNAAATALAAGATAVDTFSIRVNNVTAGIQATLGASVTLTGTNDAPVLSAPAPMLTTNLTVGTGSLAAVDADAADTVTYAIWNGVSTLVSAPTADGKGTVTINPVTGTYTYVPGPAHINSPVGSAYTDSFEVVAVDGTGAISNPFTVSVTVSYPSTGSAANETFYASFGNDTITGGGGSDTVVFMGIESSYTLSANAGGTVTVAGGGDGTDTLAGIATLSLGGMPVTISGPAGNQTLSGGLGNDTLSLGSGFKGVSLGDGDDTLTVSGAALGTMSLVSGGAGNDTLLLNQSGTIADASFAHVSGIEVVELVASGAATSITMGALASAAGLNNLDAHLSSADVALNAGALSAAVTFAGGSGADTFVGGSGINVFQMQSPVATVTVNGGTTTVNDGGATDTLSANSMWVAFTGGNGHVSVNGNGSQVIGSMADDKLVVGAGVTSVDGSFGVDTLTLMGSGRTLTVSSVETLFGGTGNDVVTLADPFAGGSIDLGAGTDVLALTSLNGDLSDGAFTDIHGVETLKLGAGVSGSLSLGPSAMAAGIVAIDASAVSGPLALDVSAMSSSGLSLAAGSGTTSLMGGIGYDVVSLQMTEASATINGSAGSLWVSNGGTQLYASSVDELRFSDGKTLSVSDSTNLLTLTGGAGNDTIHVGSGIARIDGGLGNDLLAAATGSASGGITTLAGGDGDDTFQLNANASGPATGVTLVADGGNGADTFQISASNTQAGGAMPLGLTVTTGAGSDTLVIDGWSNMASSSSVVVTDFQAGPGGDVINLASLLSTFTGYAGTNPFAPGGYLQLVQMGPDTVLQFDMDGGAAGYAWADLVRLQGVTLGALTSGNFSPTFNLGGGDVLAGTSGADTLTGGAGGDLITGAGGADILTGGGGMDTFSYVAAGDSTSGNVDVITDFVTAIDKIDLSAGGSLLYVPQLTWAGTPEATAAALSNVTGLNTVGFMTDGTNGWLAVNGGSLGGTLIKLQGMTGAPTANDIIGAQVNQTPTLDGVGAPGSAFYNFEGLAPATAIGGQDGWVSNRATDNSIEMVPASGLYTGNKAFTNVLIGGNQNVEISHLSSGGFMMPTLVKGMTVTLEYDFTPTYWGNFLRVGADLDGDGDILSVSSDSTTALDPFETSIGAGYSLVSHDAYLRLADGTTVTANIDLTGAWERFRVVLDTDANNGQGAISLFYKDLSNLGVWTAVSGLQNLNANLLWTGTTAQNASLWNGIMYHAEADAAGLDNISYSVSGYRLAYVNEGTMGGAGTLVSDLVAGHFTDALVVAGGMGIAVTNANVGPNGTWEYSLDGVGGWTAMSNALSNGNALVLAASAKVRFVPASADFNGNVTFEFKAWDGTNGLASGSLADTAMGTAYSATTATANLTIDPVEDAPVWQGLMNGTVAATSFSVANGGSMSGNLMATDADGDPLTYTLLGGTKTAHGTVMLTGVNLNYMADVGYAGSDTFTVNVSDGHGNVVAQAFTANVGYDGHNLQLAPPSLMMGQSGTFTLNEAYLNPSDSIKVADSSLVYTVGTLAHQGTLMKGATVLGAGATFTQADVTADLIKYVAAGTTGSESIDLTLRDGIGGTINTNLMFSVAAANDAPTLTVGTSMVACQGGSLSIMSGTLGLNAWDPDGGPASQLSYIVTDLPDHGTLVLNGRVLAVGDAFNAADITSGGTMGLNYYNDGSTATTDSFQVRLSDGQDPQAPQTVSITVHPVNQAPVAGAGTGYALYITGGGANAVTVGDAGGKLAFSDAVTLEAWVKPQAAEVPGQMHAVVARGTAAGSVEYGLFVKEVAGQPGTFTLIAVVGGTEVTLAGTPTTFTGTWHHVAASISSGGSVTLYLDGAVYGTATIPAIPLPVTDTGLLGLGTPVGNAGYALNGLLDEVRVWHGVRTQAEIVANMSAELHGYEAGLSGYWRFDGLSPNPTDSSVNGLTSTGGTASYTFSDRLAPTFTVSNDGVLTDTLTASDLEGHALTYALYNSGSISGQPSHGILTLDSNTGAFTYTPDFGFYGTDTIRYTVSDGTFTSMPAVAKLVVQSPGDHAPVLGGLSVGSSGSAFFDGHSGYAAGQALAPSTGDFTLEAWIKTAETAAGTRIIVGQGNNIGGVAGSFALALVDGKLTFLSPDTYAGASWSLQSAATYTDGDWHHVAVVRSGGVYKLYADDQVVDTVQVGTPTAQPSATDLMVGGMHNGGTTTVDVATAFKGMIDDVRVWSEARTGTEIVTGKELQPAGTEPGLVGAWSFDNVGGAVPVASLNATGPALVPIGTSMPSVINADDKDALHFDGSMSAAMTVGNSIGQGSGPLTFEAWIRTDSYANQTIAFIGQDGSNTGMSLYVAANGKLGIGQSQNGAISVGSSVVADGQWHHVAGAVTSAGAVTYYVDGVLDGTATINPYTLTGSVYLGSSAAPGIPAQNFMGDMADVRIWGVTRDQTQVQADMVPATAGPQSGLLGAWTAQDGDIVTLTGPAVTASGNVLALSTAPVGDDHIATYAGHAISGTVETFDQDGGSLTLTTQAGGAPAHGTLTLGAGGSFTYTPTAGYLGSDSFTLQLSDGTLTTSKTYTVDVENPITLAGAAERSAVLFSSGTSKAAAINLPGDVFAGNQISVEFDVNLSDAHLAQTLFSLGVGANAVLKATVDATGHLGLYVDSDHNAGAFSSFPGVATMASSSWHHVAVSYDAGTARIYLDGSLSATVTDTMGGTIGLSSLNTMTLASELGGTSAAKGMFDNVKIWNTTLSATQIEDGPHLGSGTGENLVGSWGFDSDHGDGTGNDTDYDAYMKLGGGGHVATPPMRAAHFDATHNVDLGNAPALAVAGTDAFTYGAWVKTSSAALSTLFNVGDNVSGNGIILYVLADGTLLLDGAQQSGAATSTQAVNDGMWHHVAVSYDGAGTATYYVDGLAAGTSSGYTNLHTSGNVSYLGLRADGNEPFVGDMGDAAIWSRALGVSDIKEVVTHGLTGQEDGLTGFWMLDEGGGATAYSLTGSVNGTYDAGTAWAASDHADLVASVQQTQAFTFDGSKYLSAGDVLDPGAGDFTLEAWIKPTSLTGDQMIVAKDAPGSTQPVMSLFLHNGVPTLHLTGADGAGYVLQAGSVAINQWSHVAVTRGGDQYTLYVDGVAVQSVSALDADISNSYALTIGARSNLAGTGHDTATAFHGQIADVRLWNVERPAHDIYGSMPGNDANDEGLMASWLGTSLTDQSGNGHDLTLPSGVTNVVQSASGLQVYNDGVEVPRDGQYHGALLAHDATGAAISYSSGTAPAHGTLVLNADGSFVYKPNAGYEGLDSFTLTATAGGVSSSQVVAVRVEDPTEIIGATQHMGQLLLDGNSHAVVANTGQMAWLGGNDFTMEAWIDPTAAAISANEAVILAKQFDQGGSTVQLRLLLNGGKLAFMAADGTANDDGLWNGSTYSLKAPTALTAGEWAHVAVTRSGDVFTLYVDGEAVSSVTYDFTNNLSCNADLWVGQAVSGGNAVNGFDGAISDVRLWGYGRSASDMASTYDQVLDGDESGLIGYWNGLGGLQDLSGNGHQLILPSDNPPVMAMVPETATHFGGGSHISIGTGIGQGSGPFTYEAWVRTSYGSAAQTIFSTDSATTSQGLSVYVGADGKIHVDAVNSAGNAISTSVLNDGLWHHVAVTMATGGAYTIYVDGTAEVSGTVGAFTLNGPLNIGSDAAGALAFHGDIAEARIWNATLSGLQVSHAMNNEQTGAEAGLAGYWRLDEAPVGGIVQDATAANHDGTVVGSAVTIVHNDAPIYDDVLSAIVGSPYHGTLDAMAPTSANGDVTWALGTAPNHGTLAVNADGTFTYTPNSGWHGIDSFNVVATGSDGNTTTKMLSIRTESPVEFMGSGAAGGSLQFGGDHYAVANPVNLANKSFSWEFWANKAAQITPTAQTLLSEGSGGVGQNLFVGFDATGHLRFSLDGSGGGTAVTYNAAADTGAWHHWAGTYDATTNTLTLYRDGMAVQSAVAGSDYTDNANLNLYVGGTPASGGSYVGQLDEVRLFDDVRTAAEIWNNWHRTESVSTDHLIAEWSMDRVHTASNSTTGMVLDTSGHNSNLALVSTVADMAGSHGLVMGMGTSLSTFGGHAALAVGSQGLVAANAATLVTGTGAFTYGAWVRTSGAGRQEILGIGDVNAAQGAAEFYIENGQVVLAGPFVDPMTSIATVNDGNWHHVAVSYDGAGQVAFYVDGAASGTGAASNNFNILMSSPLSGATVGGLVSSPATNVFGGQLSDVAVWNTALDSTQVLAAKTQGAAAVAAGNLLADWTMSAAETAVYVNTSGKVADFNGASSHVHVADTSRLDFDGDFTVETWIRPDANASAHQSILSATSLLGGSTVNLFNLEIAGGQLVFSMVGDAGSNTPSAGLTLLGPAASFGVWSHVAVTVHNDVATLYVNGQAIVSSSAFVGSRLGSISSFDIGSYGNAGGAFYDGLLSDVRVWDVARSGSEIVSYQGFRLSGGEDHLAGNWRLETTSAGVTPDSTGTGAGTATSVSLTGAKAALFDDVVTTREDTELRAGLFDVNHANPTQPTWATIAQGPHHGTLSLAGTTVLGTTTLSAGSVFLTGGSLSAGASGYSYTPDANYFGSDYFVVAINDGSGNLTYGTVAIGVRSVRDEPTLTGLSNFSVAENGTHALNIHVADDVGAIGGDQFTVDMVVGHGAVSLRTLGGITFASSTVNGSSHLVFTGTLDRINAALSGATYSAEPLWTGADAITFSVWDTTTGGSLTASGTIGVTMSGTGNLAPEVDMGDIGSSVAGAVYNGMLMASDPEGGTLTFAKTSNPLHGTVTVDSGGTYHYAGAAGYTGWDSFGFSASDGTNTSTGTSRVAVYDHARSWAGGAVGNWDSGALTDPGALVQIGTATVSHLSGSDAVGGLLLTNSTLTLSGGTLALGVAGELDAASRLDIGGGAVLSLANDAILTDFGGLNLVSGAMLAGGGTVVANGVTTLSGSVGLGGNTVVLNNGATLSGATLSGTGSVQMNNGSLWVNASSNWIGAAFENAAATLLLVNANGGDASLVFQHAFDNRGEIVMSGSADPYAAQLIVHNALTNHGSIDVGGFNSSADTIGATSFTNYGTVEVRHDLNLSVGTFDNYATLTLSGGNSLTVSDTGSLSHAHFDNHGKIAGSGGINVADADMVNHGYINPGDSSSTGTLTVMGSLTMGDDAHLVMDFWNGGFDRLNVNGILTLDGTLDLYTHGTVSGSPSATLLSWSSLEGSFDLIHGIDSGSGWIWDPTVTGNNLTVTAHAATYVNNNGYYSGSSNGTVGAGDYVIGYGSNEVVHLNGGHDVYVGHGSYNTVGVTDLNFDFLDGGSGGGNTLQWENINGQCFDLSALWTNALQNFDVLDLSHAGNANAVLDLAHLQSMLNGTNAVTGTANALVVIGGSNVTLADSGWQATGTTELTVNGQHDSYTQYSNGDTHVYVENHTHVG